MLQLQGKVGEGTFGDVWKAQYKDDGYLVAIKKIKMEKESQGFPITAIREIKILNVLKHVNIVEMKEVVSFTGGLPPLQISNRNSDLHFNLLY